ncbi:sigma-54-dependent transcriptional regulator [Bacteroidota bacterium]
MNKKGKILIVDDNKSILDSLELYLKYKFEFVKPVNDPNLIPGLIQKYNFDIVILDMNFSSKIHTGNEGIYWLRRIHKIDSSIIVIMITAYGDIGLAVKAIKEGANDFILKPWDNNKLHTTLENSLQLKKSKEEVVKLKEKQKLLEENIDKHYPEIIGRSKVMQDVFETVKKVAKTDANVLILGENGTGKELVARELHRLSKRKNEIFVEVDMGSLSESLFESEMFGHIKGSFTDAKENRTGRFEMASGGSLFLDEIGNLSLSLQSKLLKALQERKIVPIGSSKEKEIDIRLICATNKDLSEMLENDLFREDLLFRINTIQIIMPPLRERENDILLLTEKFLSQYGKKYDKPRIKINAEALKLLKDYHWPGNVRELRHTVEKAVIMSDSEVLLPEDFALSTQKKVVEKIENLSLDEAEKRIIAQSLQKNKGNISDTARDLKIGRQTLYRKITKYKL